MHTFTQWYAKSMSISCAGQMRRVEAQQVLRTLRVKGGYRTTPPLSQSGCNCVCREQARLDHSKNLPHLVGSGTGRQILKILI